MVSQVAGGPDLTNWMKLLLPKQETVKQPRLLLGRVSQQFPSGSIIRFYTGNLWTLLTMHAPVSAETLNADMDPQKVIVLPGLEVSKAKKKAVQDIWVWSQCFALYVAILARKFPDRVQDLMAYQLLIFQTRSL